jgi:hypothetical protein
MVEFGRSDPKKRGDCFDLQAEAVGQQPVVNSRGAEPQRE